MVLFISFFNYPEIQLLMGVGIRKILQVQRHLSRWPEAIPRCAQASTLESFAPLRIRVAFHHY